MNATRILSLPTSVFMQAISNESPKELHVVIQRPTAGEGDGGDAAPNAFDTIIQAMRPIQKSFQSDWSVSDVLTFQSGYATARNKATYLSQFTKDDKPTIDQQIQAFAAHFLTENDLGFKGGSGGEEESSLSSLKFVIANFDQGGGAR